MAAPEAAAPASGSRHPLVARVLEATATESVRLAAARGTLPIPVHELLYLQIRLLEDPAPMVSQAASESLDRVPVEVVRRTIEDPDCDPLLLDYFARSGRLAANDLAHAVSHPRVSDATLEFLAGAGSTATLKMVVANEVRVIRNPRLLKRLRNNPNLSPESRRRLGELESDFIGKEPIVARRPAPTSPEDAGVELPRVGEEAPEGTAPPEPAEPPEEETPAEPPPEEVDYDEEALQSSQAFQRIMKMNVPERVHLAMSGSAEERGILIRDPTKMVAMQVLKSPKLSEKEISAFAGMRNVHEDVLRKIASSRSWTKNYAVIQALIRNSKTPAGLTLGFLPRLGTRDLRLVAADKNIPEILRRHAQEMFQARTQPKKKHGKKR